MVAPFEKYRPKTFEDFVAEKGSPTYVVFGLYHWHFRCFVGL
jgi:hypothetical protein